MFIGVAVSMVLHLVLPLRYILSFLVIMAFLYFTTPFQGTHTARAGCSRGPCPTQSARRHVQVLTVARDACCAIAGAFLVQLCWRLSWAL